MQLIYKFVILKNLRRHIVFIILICFGFVLLPSTSYSCAKEATKTNGTSTAHEQRATHPKTDGTCSEDASRKENHSDCEHRKCDHVTCRCLSSSCSVFLTTPFDINLREFSFVTKQKFGFKQNNYSSEFSHIWLPPKIG